MSGRQPARSDVVFAALLLAVGALLLLPSLGDRLLWQDEAETALLARSVLREGVPTAWDGRNWVSADGRREFGEDHVWWWTPWLQHYLAAASFALWGEGTVAARLPFVLLGLACLPLCFSVARRAADPVAARFAAASLLFSVPFLLHMRQCRYYAPAAFFTLLALHEALRLRAGGRGARLGMAVAATGLLHSHYVLAAAVGSGLLVHAVLTRGPRRAVPLAQGWAAALLLFAPFGVRFLQQAGGTALPGIGTGLESLRLAIDHENLFVLPLWLVPVLAWLRWGAPGAEREGEGPGWGLVAFTVLWVTPFMAFLMPDFFFRYYVALVPLGAILQGVALGAAWRWRARWARPLAVVLAAALLWTDLPARAFPRLGAFPNDVRYLRTGDEDPGRVVAGWARFVPLAAYLYELGHDVDGPLEAVIAHLRQHAKPGDTVVATYGDLTLQFYTDLRVVGGMSREDPTPHLDAEWLLVRPHVYFGGDVPLARTLSERVDWSRYRRVPLEARDVPFENRPDPVYHKFRTVTEGVPRVRLYRRRD